MSAHPDRVARLLDAAYAGQPLPMDVTVEEMQACLDLVAADAEMSTVGLATVARQLADVCAEIVDSLPHTGGG